jgi:hypothetical protein
MSLFLVLLLASTAGFIGVALFTMWWMGRVSHVAITSQFQAAEFILEHHTAPLAWSRPKGPFTWLLQGSRSINWRNQLERSDARTRMRILEQLDELIAFFEICPFFQDEESREVLLGKLTAERDSWQQKTVTELSDHESEA